MNNNIDERAENFIIDNLSLGELIALRYDIPIADDEASGFDGFNFDGYSFDGEFDSADGNLAPSRRFDFDGNDNEFSDFGKKTRQKVGGAFKKVGSAVGGAVKKVTSGVKNTVQKVGDKIGDSKIGQAIKNSKVGGGIVSGLQKIQDAGKKITGKIGDGLSNLKDKAGTVIKKVGDKIGDGLKAVGRGVVVATMSIPRASARTLISLNFRGVATRMAESGGDKNKKLSDLWYKLGGNPSKLWQSMRTGQNKKPKLCGAKCKEKMGKSNFAGMTAEELYKNARTDIEYSNLADPVLASIITTGGVVIGKIATTINQNIQNKVIREQLAQEEKLYNKELEQRADELNVQKDTLEKQFELAEQNAINNADPIKLIQNNPNLSPEEKAEAIKQAQDVLGSETTSKIKKYAIYGGLGLLGLLATVFIIKKARS